MKQPLVSIVIPTKDREENLYRLLISLQNSTYKNQEIIIINNSIKDLQDKKHKVKIINNKGNKGLAYARTRGAKEAKGKYILFIDDDNVVTEEMVVNLVETLEKHPAHIAVGPLTYYLGNKKKIWFVSVKMNLFTTKPTFIRSLEDLTLRDTRYVISENLHNCFMLRKVDGDRVGWFDRAIFMNGTEYDLFQKIKKIRKGILVTDTKARDYHNVPDFSTSLLRSMGFENELRVYYFQRNRGLLVGRYGTFLDKIALLVIFYPLFLIAYSILFILFKKWRFLWVHINATYDGYKKLLRGGI